VEELIGSSTVNTIRLRLSMRSASTAGYARADRRNVENAADTMDALERAGIPMKTVTDTLLEEGLRQFVDGLRHSY